MRTPITISLTEGLLAEVHQQVKKGKFSSVSEYIRHVIREQARQRLARELKQQQKDFRKGKFKVLENISDLDTW